jgi:hypothetical protein
MGFGCNAYRYTTVTPVALPVAGNSAYATPTNQIQSNA